MNLLKPAGYRPYRSATADFSLGLHPARPGNWIEFAAGHAENMRAKRARLAADGGRYYRALPESLPAQHELRDRVLAHLVADHPQRFSHDGQAFESRLERCHWRLDEPGVEPLRQLSEIVEEDFMLLAEVEGILRITAAANAYSSSGRLVSAVGQGVEWAHRPVPMLTAKLGPRIDRVLASIHESTPCERFNWQVTPMATLFFPPEDPHAANAAAMRAVQSTLAREPERAGELLHIRVERQTLTRLPRTRAVAFSLHTYSDPLSVLTGDPPAAAAMLRLLEGYADERWHYTEMDLVRAPLLAYLRRCSGAT